MLRRWVIRAGLVLALSGLSACGDRSHPGSGADAGTPGDGGGTSCPAGESWFEPGCGSGEDVTITAGCYRTCAGADDGSCPEGTTCRRTDIDPCSCPAGEGCCVEAVCGAEQWLCLAGGGGTGP